MPTPITLQARLQEIAHSLEQTGHAYALLGLGSAGIERDRMDEYSDLDFFVIAKEGHKQSFIENLYWLTDIHPAGYSFQNTADGHKFLYEDGIFCEFAVFEPHELSSIPFSAGQVVWAEHGFNTECLTPINPSGTYQRSSDINWIMGESLTNLYVGLGRYHRGEKLSAMKFVQSFSLDRIIDLMYLLESESSGFVDRYMPDRRLEQRFETAETYLSEFCQGYDKTPESALAQLRWLQQHLEVNQAMAEEIEKLAQIQE